MKVKIKHGRTIVLLVAGVLIAAFALWKFRGGRKWPSRPFFVVPLIESMDIPEDSTEKLSDALKRAVEATLDSTVRVVPVFYGRVSGRDAILRILKRRSPLLVWWIWVEPESTKLIAFRAPEAQNDTIPLPDTLIFVRNGEFDALSLADAVLGVSYFMGFLKNGDSTALNAALPRLENVAVDYEDRDAWLLLGWCYLGEGRYSLARQAVLRADTSDFMAAYGLGVALLREQRMDSAMVAFQGAIAHAPHGSVMPIFGYAEALIKLEMPDEGIMALRSGLKKMPDYPRGHFLMGLAFDMAQRYDSAMFYYRKAHELDSTWATPLYNLALVYDKIGDTSAAIKSYRAVLKIDSLALDAMENIAWLYLKKGQPDSSRRWFERILAHDSLSTDAIYGLALSYMEDGDFDVADSLLIKCISVSPEYLPAYLKRVQLALESGQVERAFDVAREAIDSLPDEALVYNALGAVYLASGDYRSSVRVLEQALQLNPSEIDIISNLGLAYQMLDDLENALKYYRKAAEISSDPELLANMASIYIEEHRPDEALKALNRAEKADSSNARVQYLKGIAYFLKGNIGLARLSFVKCKQLSDDIQLQTMAHTHLENLSRYGTL